MIRHALARQRERVPVGALRRVQPIRHVRHPQIAPLLIVVDQPHAARVAFALFDQRLGEHAEEALDVRLAHQQIERELDDLGLDFRAALRAMAFGRLANQRGAQHLRIVRRRFFGGWLTACHVALAVPQRARCDPTVAP